MHILFKSETAQDKLLPVRYAISVCVFKKVDIGNAESDNPIFKRIEANRDVQSFSKGGELGRTTLGVEGLQDSYFVPSRLIKRCRVRIFTRLRQPKSSPSIKCHVHGLANVRFRCD